MTLAELLKENPSINASPLVKNKDRGEMREDMAKFYGGGEKTGAWHVFYENAKLDSRLYGLSDFAVSSHISGPAIVLIPRKG